MAIDPETFEAVVAEALDQLPDEFARFLDNVVVLVEARPTREHRRSVGLKPWQTLYGLYQGVPLAERDGALTLPDTITIFREPLVRDFPARAELMEQIRRTVYHEIAHVFGISDDRLRELGAY